MVKLISITEGAGELLNKNAQEIIAYTARVSNPSNQMNFETAPKLLAYLIKHMHWSPFEMVHLTMEIKTSRGIAAQILRHRSFSFQEFSMRYAESGDYVLYPARRQDNKNRQNSVDDMTQEDKEWFNEAQYQVWEKSKTLYDQALLKGIAKEQARFLLPLNTETTLYMCGSARSWIHYIDLRCGNGTQLEHRQVALACKKIFCEQLPDVANAMEWL
jgi:thymidylate synthase (FAD)